VQLAGDTEDVDISQGGRAGGETEPLLLLLVVHAAICSSIDQRRPRHQCQEALISGTQTATTGASLRIFTNGFQHCTLTALSVTARTRHSDAAWFATQCANGIWS
jgi:hypothetical protein